MSRAQAPKLKSEQPNLRVVPKAERPKQVVDHLPELITLERIIKSIQSKAEVREEASVKVQGHDLPVYSITLGSRDPRAPVVGVFGGVHGLERIGTEVVLAWLDNLNELLNWDDTLHQRLEKSRLVFMPLVNPSGMFLRRRSNNNSVDLMRNAPVEAEGKPSFLLAGHRYSKLLPWYRGFADSHEQMEIEARALCDTVEREMFGSSRALSIDVHSGFGTVDRLWFPYAKTKEPPPHLGEIMALKRLFDQSYANHVYHLEPQSKSYITHGDLWDYLYDRHQAKGTQSLFLPWTLELGSWLWLKKNPRQFFSALGPFNPIQPHRIRRTLRRHLILFDFFHRAVLSGSPWSELDEEMRASLIEKARQLWYEK